MIQAQKITEKNVPEAVTSVFKKDYPAVSETEWCKEGNNFEAEYTENKVEKSITYDVLGNLVRMEEEIKPAALPTSIKEYVNKKFKKDTIEEASKITDAKGIITYKVEIKAEKLTFDSNGNFIASVKK